jgi:hypothetical protein
VSDFASRRVLTGDNRALLDELYSGNHLRLGDAVLASQETYVDSGAWRSRLLVRRKLGAQRFFGHLPCTVARQSLNAFDPLGNLETGKPCSDS